MKTKNATHTNNFMKIEKKKKFHVFYVYVTLYIGVTLLYL